VTLGGLWKSPVRAVIIDRIVAVVNKDIITLSEVQEAGKAEFEELKVRYNGDRLKREVEKLQRKYLDLLIRRRLQINRAKEMDLSFTENEVEKALDDVKERNGLTDAALETLLTREGFTIEDYRKRIGDEILLRRVVNIEVSSRVSVTTEEVRAYYDSHIKDYMPPERLRAGHILFLTPVNAPRDVERAKRAAAEEVLGKIRSGASFEEMAKRYSQDPSGAKGGDLGIISRGEVLPNFERVLFSLKEGEVSDIARTRAGFHLIKLVKRLPAEPKSFSEVETQIRNKIFQKKAEERMQRWLEDLKKRTHVEVTM
jgi:peptidyl-prolyl cis-trans isomerase SurA